MRFVDCDKILTSDEIESVEAELGIVFPNSLRDLFLKNNGGEPEPYVFQDELLHAVVNETLPLISDTGRETAVETYQDLVLQKGIAKRQFFPFAIDAGGDYFFVDCSDSNAPVFFYKSDTAFSSAGSLEKIANSLDEFWAALQPEEE